MSNRVVAVRKLADVETDIATALQMESPKLSPEDGAALLEIQLALFAESKQIRDTQTNKGYVPTLPIGAKSMCDLMRLPLDERLAARERWNVMFGNLDENAPHFMR